MTFTIKERPPLPGAPHSYRELAEQLPLLGRMASSRSGCYTCVARRGRLCYQSGAVTKYTPPITPPTHTHKSNLRKEGLGLPVTGYSPPGQRSHELEAAGHIAPTVRKQKAR